MTTIEEAVSVSTDDAYERAARGLPCWVRDTGGRRVELPMARWLGGPGMTPDEHSADQALLARCTGTTIDLGCGPGRFTAALAARGVPALGVDSSVVAVRLANARGGMAMHRDIFGSLPGAGHWARVLLADGNIGIGGDPARVLRRATELLRPGGRAVVEVEPAGCGIVATQLRIETESAFGEWFHWARVGADAVGSLAAAVGLELQEIIGVAGRHIATLVAG